MFFIIKLVGKQTLELCINFEFLFKLELFPNSVYRILEILIVIYENALEEYIISLDSIILIVALCLQYIVPSLKTPGNCIYSKKIYDIPDISHK